MKGILAFMLMLGLGFISWIIQGTEIIPPGSEMVVPVMAAEAVPHEETATIVHTEVDRDDDPNEALPCTPAPNDCSLRQALLIANSDGAPTTITFADHYVITLAKPLPTLSEAQTVIQARPEQEVHINGNQIAQSVFYITGANATISGLRIYGAGTGFSNVRISGAAHHVTIADNVIGDGDAPSGNCGHSDAAYGGIFIDGQATVPTAVRAWIYGNIIECHRGGPGDGITIMTDKVIVGQDSEGRAELAQRNILRWNNGYGVNVSDYVDNIICNSLIHNNQAGNLYMTNFNNDVMNNEMR